MLHNTTSIVYTALSFIVPSIISFSIPNAPIMSSTVVVIVAAPSSTIGGSVFATRISLHCATFSAFFVAFCHRRHAVHHSCHCRVTMAPSIAVVAAALLQYPAALMWIERAVTYTTESAR